MVCTAQHITAQQTKAFYTATALRVQTLMMMTVMKKVMMVEWMKGYTKVMCDHQVKYSLVESNHV